MERTYPAGVPSWVDLQQPDVDAAVAFYTALLGWEVVDALPPDAGFRYAIASKDGAVVGALCGPGEGPGVDEGLPGAAGWQTYVAVDDAEAAARAVTDAGGRVLQPPTTAGDVGTSVVCADPDGAVFRLWQAGRRTGVDLTNVPGAWNFSHLHTDRPAVVTDFYAPVLGWRVLDQGWGTWLQVEGYGDHLAATVDPDIHERQANAPAGFADVVAGVEALGEGERAHWHVVFSVEDRDAGVARVRELGGEVLATEEGQWARTALVRDPQGAVLTLSQFAPPEDYTAP